MPIAIEQVKHRMCDLGITVKEVASELDINESTYYRKIANNGDTFSIVQIQRLAEFLKLTKMEAREIFLP